MKWEKYNKLTDKEKEEFNFKFNLNRYDLIFHTAFLGLIIGLLIQIYYGRYSIIILSTIVMLFWDIIIYTKSYQKQKWLKEKLKDG
ncbi:MAG TPA: hypothetical protein VMQ58_01995 [Candidatus Saccharimonadales bacterium]|nr:hypothetical protein [Candidatus Saccharimonadales bacterium]